MVDDVRADEIVVSSGTLKTLGFGSIEQAVDVTAFARHPWAAFLHLGGKIVVRDAELRTIRSLGCGGSSMILIAPDDSDIIAGTKNFRSWSTTTWTAGAYSWKSGFKAEPNSAALGRDGRFAVIVDAERHPCVFDASTGARVARIESSLGGVIVLDDRFVAVSDEGVEVHALPNGELMGLVAPFDHRNLPIAIRPGTDRVVISDTRLRTIDVDVPTLALQSATDAEHLVTPELPGHCWAAEKLLFTPDGAISIAAFSTNGWSGDRSVAWIIVRDVASGRELARMTIPFARPQGLAVTPDGSTIFLGTNAFYNETMVVAWTWR